MAPTLPPSVADALRTYIDNVTSSAALPETLPGALLHVVDAQNNVLLSHGSTKYMTPSAQSISIIQSLSKLVGAIAFMQLVDRGLTSLDDPSVVPTHLPELAAQKILIGYTTDPNGKNIWQFEDRKGDITPRMLLNHTYGGGHTYFNKLLLEYFQDKGIWEEKNEVNDTYNTVLASPLLWQPGTKTNYGQGLDWIAVLIERLTHQSLATYLQTNIFDPLNLTSMGAEPAFGGDMLQRPENEGKFWPRILRTPDGLLTIDAPHPERIERKNAYPEGDYHTGSLGTGLMASAENYTHLLTTLLPVNAGTDPVTGHRLLSPESVAEIITPSLPAHIRNESRLILNSGAAPIILPVDLSSAHLDPHGSFGLACGVQGADRILEDGKRGRSKKSVYWYGAANTEFWVDVERGIVVYVNGNYYPWNESAWMGLVSGVEGIIYEGLVQ